MRSQGLYAKEWCKVRNQPCRRNLFPGIQTRFEWVYAVEAQTSLAPLSWFHGSRVTTAHAHQCCIFQSYAKTVPSRMKLTMREPASMTTDTWSRRVTSDFNSVLRIPYLVRITDVNLQAFSFLHSGGRLFHFILDNIDFTFNCLYAVKAQTSLAPLSWFHGSRVTILRMCTNVVYFRVMRTLCRREWNWLWNWRCVNQHSWDPWQRTTWSWRVTSDFNSVLVNFLRPVRKPFLPGRLNNNYYKTASDSSKQ